MGIIHNFYLSIKRAKQGILNETKVDHKMKELFKNATLRQLRIFILSAEYQSYARAAEILDLSQPAISMQIKKLSNMAGINLFDKSGREIKLSPAGRAFLPYARQAIETLKGASDELGALKQARLGKIKLGMVTTTQYFSPYLTTQFSKKHPDIKLDITIANRRNIIHKLEVNEIELAIMGRTPQRLKVIEEQFYEHPYVIIAPGDHHLSGKTKIKPSELTGEHFLVREKGSGTRLIADHFFAEHQLNPPHLQEFSNNESIKQGVIAGMGLAVISAHTIHLEKNSHLITVIDAETMPQMRAWLVLHTQSKILSPAALAFKKFMEEDAPKHMRKIFN